jgi:hypothetical protein
LFALDPDHAGNPSRGDQPEADPATMSAEWVRLPVKEKVTRGGQLMG